MKQSATGGDVVVGDGSDVLLSQPLWKVDGFVAIVKVWTKKIDLENKECVTSAGCLTIFMPNYHHEHTHFHKTKVVAAAAPPYCTFGHHQPAFSPTSMSLLFQWVMTDTMKNDFFSPIFLFHNNSSAVSSLYATWETNLSRANVACLRKHNARFVLGIFHEKRLIIQVKLWIMWALTGLTARRCSTFPAGNFNTLAVMIVSSQFRHKPPLRPPHTPAGASNFCPDGV